MTVFIEESLSKLQLGGPNEVAQGEVCWRGVENIEVRCLKTNPAAKRRNDEQKHSVPLLEHYKTEFLSGRKKRMFFTANINACHWVPWVIIYSDSPVIGHGE